MKCASCKKKLKLTEQITKCRCGCSYCAEHFFYENHKCTFDYVTFEKKILSEANKEVVAPKLINKI